MIDISYSQIRILETAKSLRKLVKVYSAGGASQVYASQLEEVAGMLEEVAGTGTDICPDYEDKGRIIRKRLMNYGIKTDSIFFYHKGNGQIDIAIKLHMAKHGCAMTQELAQIISEGMGKSYVPVKGCRITVGDKPVEIVLEESPMYYVLNGHAGISKHKNIVSGDSFTFTHSSNGHAVAGIADGMGTGERAEQTSKMVMELVEQFTDAGFSERTTAGLINSALSFRDEDNPVTIDIAGFDLNSGTCRFIKLGAAASFVMGVDGVRIIKPSSLPAGVIEEAGEDVTDVKINDGEYVVMISDGVIDAIPFYDKEQQFARIIDEAAQNHTSPQKLADNILEEVLFYETGQRRDDMTVLVTGVWRTKNLHNNNE